MNEQRIYSHYNKNAFFHVEVAPRNDKNYRMVKFWAGKTQDGKTVSDARHYLTYSDARYLCYLISTNQIPIAADFRNYAGFKDSEGRVMCRVLKIARAEEDKWFFSVGRSIGEEGGNGYVMPKRGAPKETWVYTKMVFNLRQITQFALDLKATLDAISVAEILAA